MSLTSSVIAASRRISDVSGLPFGGGVIIFALPFFALTALADANDHINWATQYSNVMAFVWLALAPDFIRNGKSALDRFVIDVAPLFKSAEAHAKYVAATAERVLSNRFAFLGVPLAFSTGVLFWFTFETMPPLTRATQALFYSTLIFVSSIGWWAIGVLLSSIRQLESEDLRIDPFHWDGFGGYRCCGTLGVKWCTLFFSGSLLFPKVLELLQPAGSRQWLDWIAYALPISFLTLGAAGFLYSQFLVHSIVASGKRNELSAMKQVLDIAHADVLKFGLEAQSLRQVPFDALKRHYEFFYLKVIGIRAWPFDYRVLLQLVTSALIPIVMAALEISKRMPIPIAHP